jgi:tetratricopeptide (TPR) repeat protein
MLEPSSRHDPRPSFDKATIASNMATQLSKLGEHAEANGITRQVVEYFTLMLGDDDVDHVLPMRGKLGYALMQSGDLAGAEAELDATYAAFVEQPSAPVDHLLSVVSNCVLARAKRRSFDDIVAFADRALLVAKKRRGEKSLGSGVVLETVGDVANTMERFAEADAWFRRAIAFWVAFSGETSNLTTALDGHATALAGLGRPEEAAAVRSRRAALAR